MLEFSYFHSPAIFCWWGSPVLWEISVVVVAACSAVALFTASPKVCGFPFIVSAISTPFLFGLIATVFQIQVSLSTYGIRPPFYVSLTLIVAQICASHIGLISSVALLLLSLGLKVFRRKTIVT